MKPPEIPENEAARLAALRALNILDTDSEPDFDEVAKLAAYVCKTPTALVSLVDADRQWFKARVGLDATETPREVSFCGHVVASNELLNVPDATKDERFFDNPLVCGQPGIRFYAGAPLVTREGYTLGTLCVVDYRPRELDPEQIAHLRALAHQLSRCLELRRTLERERDIEQRRKAAEEQLLHLAQIVESSDDAIISKKLDGEIVSWNPGAQQLYGYSADEAIGRPIALLVPEGREDEMKDLLQRIGRGERVDRFETVRARKDGSLVDVGLQLSPVRDAKGVLIGASAHARDITARKRAEELRRKAVEEKDRFFSTALDMLCISGFDGKFKLLNPAWEKVLGYPTEELIGRPFLDFVHPDDRDSTAAEAARLTDGEITIEFENRYRCKNGDYRWLLWAATPDTENELLYAVARDITERKNAEAELRRLNAILEATPDFVGMFSPTGEPLYINQAAREMLGLDSHQQSSFDHVRDAHPGWAARKLVREAIPHAQEHGVWIGESAVLHRSGKEIPVLQVILAHYDSGGRVEFISAVGRDITDRKRAEQLKNDFISTVSHELRTPLTSILGSLGLVSGGAVGELPERAMSLLQIAHNNSERLVRLINNILDMEKIESGNMKFEMSPHDLAEVVTDAVEGNRSYADKHGVRYELTNPVGRLMIRGDQDGLRQVLDNLLSNAAKFSPEGEIVEVEVSRRKGRFRVSVTDRGPGISEAFRTRIFQKFAQADASSKRKHGGTGLGLSICKAIVEKHQGLIDYESREGKRTTFFFEIPSL